jgi:hypothetical protein
MAKSQSIIVHLANGDADPGESERLAEVIRKADPKSIGVGDEFTAEDGAVYRITRVDQRRVNRGEASPRQRSAARTSAGAFSSAGALIRS